ncbi:MAG: asparagine synthase (glutamine-hydrolyzing) [Bacteroidia bacterium]
MCGISGYFSPGAVFTKADLTAMTDALAHRGPDADGYFMENAVGLGHRRLSILDLREVANQPMHSQNDRYVIVYNGEVYNFNEIANELKTSHSGSEKLVFATSSDTEVILEAFSAYGPAFVEKLNGMFAIAIYDKVKEELFLFRDRVGIKPLYYYWDGVNLLFASELKALKKARNLKLTINPQSIFYFLHLGFIPAPYSIYTEINKLEPGSSIKVSTKGIQFDKYWSPGNCLKPEVIKSEKQALVIMSDLLMSSVQYQLKSDVPFGVFLSGGIDSSLITSLAVNLSNSKVNTFSIGFQENRFNESDYARAIAKHLGTNHNEFIVSYKDAINNIENIFEAYSEPFSDSSAIPTMLVSRLAKKYVTVTLSGEGGDELFMGYGAYRWARRFDNPLIRLFHNQIGELLKLTSSDRLHRIAKLLSLDNMKNLNSHIFSQEQYLFSFKEISSLLVDGSSLSGLSVLNKANFNSVARLTAEEKQCLFDLTFYLPDDLLTKVDRASMFYSLETRVPYLDHRIIEFSLNLSPELKIRNGVSKYLLKEILYQYIPQSYFNRPKQGFAIPLVKWLRNELKYLIDENLDRGTIEKFNVVNYSEVEELKKKFYAGQDHLYNRLWLLIVLHKWLIKNER